MFILFINAAALKGEGIFSKKGVVLKILEESLKSAIFIIIIATAPIKDYIFFSKKAPFAKECLVIINQKCICFYIFVFFLRVVEKHIWKTYFEENYPNKTDILSSGPPESIFKSTF